MVLMESDQFQIFLTALAGQDQFLDILVHMAVELIAGADHQVQLGAPRYPPLSAWACWPGQICPVFPAEAMISSCAPAFPSVRPNPWYGFRSYISVWSCFSTSKTDSFILAVTWIISSLWVRVLWLMVSVISWMVPLVASVVWSKAWLAVRPASTI